MRDARIDEDRRSRLMASRTLRPDLHPEEIEPIFVRPPPAGEAPGDIHTTFVRIVPWEFDERRQRTIAIDAWRWVGVPLVPGGSAREAEVASNRAMTEVMATRRLTRNRG